MKQKQPLKNQYQKKNKFIEFIKKEIKEITLVCTKKKRLKNPFIAFKYLLYIPLALISAVVIIVIILLSAFFLGVNNAIGTKKGEIKKY